MVKMSALIHCESVGWNRKNCHYNVLIANQESHFLLIFFTVTVQTRMKLNSTLHDISMQVEEMKQGMVVYARITQWGGPSLCTAGYVCLTVHVNVCVCVSACMCMCVHAICIFLCMCICILHDVLCSVLSILLCLSIFKMYQIC